jgi:hypothetical protein
MLSHEDVKVSSINVTAVRPEPEDLRRLRFLEANERVPSQERYYIAKIYMDKPLPPTAMAPDFYVGDEQIPKYAGFKGGIYFKVHDPRFLQRNAGKTLRFTLDGTTFHDTGVTLPRFEAASGAEHGFSAERRDAGVHGRAGETLPLPTKAEVLKQ